MSVKLKRAIAVLAAFCLVFASIPMQRGTVKAQAADDMILYVTKGWDQFHAALYYLFRDELGITDTSNWDAVRNTTQQYYDNLSQDEKDAVDVQFNKFEFDCIEFGDTVDGGTFHDISTKKVSVASGGAIRVGSYTGPGPEGDVGNISMFITGTGSLVNGSLTVEGAKAEGKNMVELGDGSDLTVTDTGKLIVEGDGAWIYIWDAVLNINGSVNVKDNARIMACREATININGNPLIAKNDVTGDKVTFNGNQPNDHYELYQNASGEWFFDDSRVDKTPEGYFHVTFFTDPESGWKIEENTNTATKTFDTNTYKVKDTSLLTDPAYTVTLASGLSFGPSGPKDEDYGLIVKRSKSAIEDAFILSAAFKQHPEMSLELWGFDDRDDYFIGVLTPDGFIPEPEFEDFSNWPRMDDTYWQLYGTPFEGANDILFQNTDVAEWDGDSVVLTYYDNSETPKALGTITISALSGSKILGFRSDLYSDAPHDGAVNVWVSGDDIRLDYDFSADCSINSGCQYIIGGDWSNTADIRSMYDCGSYTIKLDSAKYLSEPYSFVQVWILLEDSGSFHVSFFTDEYSAWDITSDNTVTNLLTGYTILDGATPAPAYTVQLWDGAKFHPSGPDNDGGGIDISKTKRGIEDAFILSDAFKNNPNARLLFRGMGDDDEDYDLGYLDTNGYTSILPFLDWPDLFDVAVILELPFTNDILFTDAASIKQSGESVILTYNDGSDVIGTVTLTGQNGTKLESFQKEGWGGINVWIKGNDLKFDYSGFYGYTINSGCQYVIDGLWDEDHLIDITKITSTGSYSIKVDPSKCPFNRFDFLHVWMKTEIAPTPEPVYNTTPDPDPVTTPEPTSPPSPTPEITPAPEVTVTESKDGSTTTTTVTENKDGSTTTTEVVEEKDGTVTTTEVTENKDGSITTETEIESTDGTKVVGTKVENPDGSSKTETAILDKDGNVLSAIEEEVTVDAKGTETVTTTIENADGSKEESVVTTTKKGKVESTVAETSATGKLEITLGKEDKTGLEVTKKFVEAKKGGIKLTDYDTKNNTTASIPGSITIGDKTYEVTTIAKNAFAGNDTLKKAKLPDSIVEIGKGAFQGASSLKKIELGSEITKVKKNAFKGIAKNATITIRGSKEDFDRTVALIEASGIDPSVKFKWLEK